MRKNLINHVSFGLILLLAFSLCPINVFAASSKPILKKGMSSSEVKKLQSSLQQLGFLSQKPTGYYGDATVAAVIKFQKKYGIPAAGVVATLTYNKLEALLKPPAPKKPADKPVQAPVAQKPDGLKKGMTSQEVLKLQSNLKLLGYMNVSPTGNFGSITESALIQFQKYYKLDPSGVAGADTLAIVERLVRQADPVSRGSVDRVSYKPVYDINLQWIPELPQIPYLKGIGKYEGVVFHFTENMKDTAQIEANYEKSTWYLAFVHEFIDPKEIIQVANPDFLAWGAGKYANDRFIHLELCHADTQSDFDASFNMITQRAAEYLYMQKLGVSPAKADGTGTLWSHWDVTRFLGGTNHSDPIAYLAKWGKSWEDVIHSVSEIYNNLLSKENNTDKNSTSGSEPIENNTDKNSTSVSEPKEDNAVENSTDSDSDSDSGNQTESSN